MQEFQAFLKMGFQHIADPQAYDHLMFIVTLCAAYRLEEWKKVVVLVTAFTIGHSLTLALAALGIFRAPADLIELLIPVTILLTSLNNVIRKRPGGGLFSKALRINYGLALFFGLIHGMGFANFFQALMGESGSIVNPLFAFNIGVELGQIAIVLGFFLLLFIAGRFFKLLHREWNLYISGAGGGVALALILQMWA